MGYQSLSLLKTCSVIMISLDGVRRHHPNKNSYMPRLRWPSPPSPPHFAAFHWLIHWFIFFTVPRVMWSSLQAKILKIFFNIDLMEVHHISKNNVCIYLSHLTIKETTVRIWYLFWNIHQGLSNNPKIMKIFVKVAERSTNNHKYRLFPISPYLSCKGQLNMLLNRICFSYNFIRSWPNWTK